MSQGLRHSDAIKGTPVTTINVQGGIGFGYLVNGRVWKTTGSNYAVDATQDVFPMVSYLEDNGEGYRKATQGLLDVSKFIGEKL